MIDKSPMFFSLQGTIHTTPDRNPLSPPTPRERAPLAGAIGARPAICGGPKLNQTNMQTDRANFLEKKHHRQGFIHFVKLGAGITVAGRRAGIPHGKLASDKFLCCVWK